jgi:CRP-like cAMP-binding protein
MRVYRAQGGQALIREGDGGDFMLLLMEGSVDIYKHSAQGERQLMTSVSPGMTLGEMSMIDGEPRFATCIATDITTFAMLTRDAMVNIILEKPSLGSKILIKLVTLLSQRLRQTSARLLQLMESPLSF